MAHLRAGWFVVLCAAVLAVSSWLPWLTTSVQGGGRASLIGGTVGSIVLPPRFGAGQLIVLLTSALIGVLIYGYYHLNVSTPVSAGYGFYVGAVCAAGALVSSVWVLIAALVRRR